MFVISKHQIPTSTIYGQGKTTNTSQFKFYFTSFKLQGRKTLLFTKGEKLPYVNFNTEIKLKKKTICFI